MKFGFQYARSLFYIIFSTSRDRPESAPYLRLKNSERTSKYSFLQQPKKSLRMPKKTERGPCSLARYCMIRGKKEKPFLFSSLDNIKFCRTFGRTILVTTGASKKTLTKCHDYSQLFSLEKSRLKTRK